jgi:hypothetical protein
MKTYLISLHFEQRGSVMIAGDRNCRVRNKPDFVVCDRNVNEIDYDDYIPDVTLCRASQDSLCNARG